jgi:hypothetical protein
LKRFEAWQVRNEFLCKLAAALLLYFDGDVTILEAIVNGNPAVKEYV